MDKYSANHPLVMVTATDHPLSQVCDRSGVDMILVGDSLGMTALGYDTTLPVTMDNMIHHCKAVMRGSRHAMVVADMPFGSYEPSVECAVNNAVRMVKEAGVHAVKLEGGEIVADRVRAIVQAGIPVIGHIGLTPQRINIMGGFKVRGRSVHDCIQLVRDARALQEAGCAAIVLECIPASVATLITKRVLSIPTIGIGSGVGCSGQVLVLHDLLGMFDKFVPKFCKRYATLSPAMIDAVSKYRDEVERRVFPSDRHSFKIPAAELRDFKRYLGIEVGEKMINDIPAPDRTPLFSVDKKNIVVFGSGAMACSLAARLNATGACNVAMFGHWEEGIEDVRREGITLSTRGDNEKMETVIRSKSNEILATMDLDNILASFPRGTADIVFIATKTYFTNSYASELGRLDNTGDLATTIVTLQNGIGNRDRIQQLLSEQGTSGRNVIQGVTYDGAILTAPGHVLASSNRFRIILPKTDTGLLHDLVKCVSAKSGNQQDLILLEEAEDMESLTWEKAIVNAAINPVTALLRVPNGSLLESSYARSTMYQIVEEALQVAKLLPHVKLSSYDVQHHMERVWNTLQSTKENRSSMLTDIERSAALGSQMLTEIDCINGAIVEIADRHEKPHLVPKNRIITNMVHALCEVSSVHE